MVLEDLKGKNFLLNILDCPGHSNFVDEAAAAIRISDGIVLVVDAVEGVMMMTERHIRLAVKNGLPICVVYFLFSFLLLSTLLLCLVTKSFLRVSLHL